MPLAAPVRIPVELRRGARWFRMAHAVSLDGLELGHAAPAELAGSAQHPVSLAFHLPGDPEPVHALGQIDERAQPCMIRFVELEEPARKRILAYLRERLLIDG